MSPNNEAGACCTPSTADLECGTSLSERAHLEQVAPNVAQASASSTSASASMGSAATAGKPATEEVGVDEIPEHPRFRNAQTIEELRDQIAADATSSQDSSPTMFWSPLEISQGQKVPLPMVYCDQTASNRPLQSLEQYLQDTCLPFYGNTHTNTSITGAQSTAFCAEARQLVAEAVNAKTTGKASQDVVLFAGNGTTSAVELLLDCLGFHHHVSNSSSINATPNAVTNTTNNKPIVFIGPFEHHSNLLPWRESGAEIVMIPERNGHVDLVAMEHLLKKHQSIDAVKIGAFTAASNVTGIVADTNAITAMLHQYGALAIWDYATGAPYLDMNMNPMDDPRYASNPAIVAKDALFFSPHKMVGGINTPGVLVVKKRLVQQMNAPRRSGGGTVFYVTQDHHRFLSNRIERYEGGTPNVVGIWRVGLTMLFKRQIQNKYAQLVQNQSDDNDDDDDATIPPTVLDYEYRTFERVATALRKIPNLVLLGDDDDDDSTTTKKRLPIFSFLIKSGRRFLHYNYVCALLNDIFGIQSRGGCQCAGPYSQRLLGLTEISSTDGMQESPSPINEQIESALLHAKERAELLRPGFTRLSLPFKGVSSQQVDYVVKAIGWIARNGWVLLPSYRCNHRTGEWRHKQRQGAPLGKRERLWLSHYSFTSSPPPPSQNQHGSSWSAVLEETMQTADKLLELARNDTPGIQQALKMTDEASGGMGDSDTALEELRWYVYPKEVAAYVAQGLEEVPGSLDRSNLLGALRPLAWYPKKPVPPQEHIEANSHMIATPDVELFNLEQSSTEQQHQHQHQHQQQQEQEQEQEQAQSWQHIVHDSPSGIKDDSDIPSAKTPCGSATRMGNAKEPHGSQLDAERTKQSVNDHFAAASTRPPAAPAISTDSGGWCSRTSPTTQTSTAPSSLQNDWGKLRVLVAEDNKINQKVCKRILSKIGVLDIDIVDNGSLAVEHEKQRDYDIVLMDLEMPVMNGLCATKHIVSRRQKMSAVLPRVLFLSAHALDEYKQQAKEAGGDGFLSKPFRMEAIKDALSKLDFLCMGEEGGV
mmetsp:Transcript_2218/g.5734  ORF Transcript_2218/g.5734 Transcript_2218/m.5734 type:complete len:1044 (+) Transcript_2218:97-3228(+)